MTSHPRVLVTLSQTWTSYTNNSDNTLLMLNVDTQIPLIPDDYWLWNSKLEAMFMSRLNLSIQHDPPRNYLINSLDLTKSLHSLAPTPSPYDFWSLHTVHLVFHVSMLELLK